MLRIESVSGQYKTIEKQNFSSQGLAGGANVGQGKHHSSHYDAAADDYDEDEDDKDGYIIGSQPAFIFHSKPCGFCGAQYALLQRSIQGKPGRLYLLFCSLKLDC